MILIGQFTHACATWPDHAVYDPIVATFDASGRENYLVDRGMRRIVVGITTEILGAKFPVARHSPFEDAAKGFPVAVAAVGQFAIVVEIEAQVT